MALYDINANLPGGKKVFSSEVVAPQGSSTFIHLVQIVLDPDLMQDSLDGYVVCKTNTSTTTVKFDAPTAVKANELRNQYVMVNFASPEVKQIVSNTAAASAGDEVTLTVSKPFSSAPTEGNSANVRLWEDWYKPFLATSLDEVADRFIEKDSSGKHQWTGQHAAFQTLKALFNNGARFIWVVPIERHGSADDLAAALSPTYTTDLQNNLLALSPQPDIVVMPKHPILTAGDDSVLDSTNWATVDNAWISYVNNRATSESTDELLREMVYVTDTGSASTSSATTYVGTTVNTTNERVIWVHGQYIVPSVTAGQVEIISPACAAAAKINYISTTAKESFGHAMYGPMSAVNGSLGLVEDLTQSNRITLRSYGINPFVVKPNGTWLESQFTAAKSTSDSGLDPVEHLHIVLGRGKIWNTLQPILASMVSEQNTAVNRAAVEAQIRGYLDGLKSQSIIEDYVLSDVTSASDRATGTVRFELQPYFIGAVDYVELKLTAKFAQ